MKLYITSFLVVLFLFVSGENKLQAQETFAPIGATWLFKVDNAFLGPQGYNKIVSTKDTMIFGKVVRQLRYEIYSRNRLQPPDPLYIYQSNDSIYRIYPEDGALQLLFRNNMEVGDTLTLPLYFPYNFEYRSLMVDSIKTLTYQLTDLKEMYLSVIGYCFSTFGVLINSRFGPFTGFSFVEDLCLEGNSELLICYEDPDFEQIQFYPFISCDIETSVEDLVSKTSFLNIYPNPATTRITLSSQPGINFGDSVLKILSLTGQTLHQQEVDLRTPLNLDVSGLPDGIYFLQITNEQGKSLTQKFVKE